MRTIEFRGKTIAEPSKWVYGNLILPTAVSPYSAIVEQDGTANVVHLESIGQRIDFSFCNEENNTKSRDYVYEGDIILAATRDEYEDDDFDGDDLRPYRIGFSDIEVVLFDKDGDAVEQWSDGSIGSYGIKLAYTELSEILGNYFDNPELMEG